MDLPTLIQTFGLPIGLLLALLFAFWRISNWLAVNVVKPLTDRHILFLDRVESLLVSQSASILKSIDTVSERHVDLQRNNVEHLKAIHQLTLGLT
ncbi:MAG: hypothetical protein ACREJC_17375, partial [Tepidisphaeraceae bacterium]